MPSVRRVLAVDVPVALVVGCAGWFSAQASRWFAVGSLSSGSHGSGRPPWSQVAVPLEIWWWPLPLLVIMVGGLAVRRLRPRIGFGLVVVGVGGYLAIGGPYGPVLFAPALVTVSLTAVLSVRRWIIPAAAVAVMLSARWWGTPWLGLLDPQAWAGVVFGLAAIMVPALIGLVLRARRDTERQARDEELRRIAYEERLRIAREVHDVVGHSLSVINLQAGVALHVLERRPEQAEGALSAIRTTSKDALEELRRTLDVFRDPDLRLAPVPGLDRLPDLVASLRAAGREVTLDDRRSVPVPAAVDQAAYRIVQESLTNVVRHTDRASAVVRLETVDGRLVVEICDDGPPTPVSEGNGITGMRERAAAVGGRLAVESGDRGVRITTELPTGASA